MGLTLRDRCGSRIAGKNHRLLNVKPLPYLKVGYKGKNENGGRKCVMKTSEEYRRGIGPCMPWPWHMESWPVPRTPDPRVLADADNASMEELEAAAAILDRSQ
jgi:hypothetical protein